jgi:hypothetical protein
VQSQGRLSQYTRYLFFDFVELTKEARFHHKKRRELVPLFALPVQQPIRIMVAFSRQSSKKFNLQSECNPFAKTLLPDTREQAVFSPPILYRSQPLAHLCCTMNLQPAD